MLEFESISIPFDGNGGRAEGGRSVNGPSIACVGWIPFFYRLAEMRECAFRHHRIATSTLFFPNAATLIFQSGNMCEEGAANNPDPRGFAGPSQFLELLESRNFRAALALDKMRLDLNSTDQPIGISFELLGEVGYTPIRILVGQQQLLTYHDRGRGSASYEVIPEWDGVVIKAWTRFKIGRLGELAGYFLTHRMAPSASMSIEYRITSQGSASVRCWGSFIPSFSLYLNWRRSGTHDMVGATSDHIDGFFEAGACQDAPGQFFFEGGPAS